MTIWRGGWRSGAREAARHVGQVYDRGYQFKYPDRALLTFGPWEAVWPFSDRGLPSNILNSLQDGIIVDGIIMPVWQRVESTLAGRTPLGARQHAVGQDLYSFIFYRSALQLNLQYNNGAGSSGTSTYAIDPGLGIIDSTSWQQSVYFVSPTLGNVRKYDVAGGTFTSILNSPQNGKFVFMLQNNLVVIREAGSIYEAVWAPDSAPESWTATGSGSNPLYNIGEVKGVGVFSDRAVIIGSAGAKVMVPIGGGEVSAFAFRDVKAIHGTPFDYGVAFSEDALFYLGYDRQMRMYRGESVQEVGPGEGVIRGVPKLFYSERLGSLIMSVPELNKTLFLNPDTGQWVSNLNTYWDFVTDSPLEGKIGYVFGIQEVGADYIQSTLNLEPDTYTLPRAKFGKVDLNGEEWVIDHVDIQRTSPDSPMPLAMTITRHTLFDYMEEDKYSKTGRTEVLEKGHRVRYFVNRPAAIIDLLMEVDESGSSFDSGPFLIDNMTASGNIPINPNNTPAGWLGNLRVADGNMDVLESSSEYIGVAPLNAIGNMELVALSQLEWLPDTGIEQVQVAIKKQTIQPQRAG